jgi:hypothetical protein
MLITTSKSAMLIAFPNNFLLALAPFSSLKIIEYLINCYGLMPLLVTLMHFKCCARRGENLSEFVMEIFMSPN